MDLYGFSVRKADGSDRPLADFRGQVLLIVNVASRCGFTPQYAGLEAVHRARRDAGFSVLGFPCNQFGGQEPGTDAQIGQFCSIRYDVTFPVFARIDVNGPNADPLYRWLEAERPGLLGTKRIKWNFTKFLIDREGRVASRHAPTTTPEALETDIRRLL